MAKKKLVEAALLVHPRQGAEIYSIYSVNVTDASDLAMGTALEQQSVSGEWEPLAFFSQKLSPAQLNYSAYDRELTAIYEALKHFRYYIEGRNFKILTDHKPLVYAFKQSSDKASPCQIRQLSFIAQFTTVIEDIPGQDNVVADPLSRIESLRLPLEINLKELAQAQNTDDEVVELQRSSNPPLKLIKLQWGPAHTTVFCEMSGEAIRPYIPASLRETVFWMYHKPAHPSAKITDRTIRQRYVWPNMHRDIALWCKQCINCQRSKVTRHVKRVPEHFVAPDGRFDQTHIDIIGPLPISAGFAYCLTMIDQFSRWVEANPIVETSARTVARAFYDTWISRYVAPKVITTDQGSQFESRLFTALLTLIRSERIRTTPYHPASNGIIERWHRVLKAAIMCHTEESWSRALSTVLMGLRSHVRADTGASSAEFLFGTAIRLPGEFFLPDDLSPNRQIFIEKFREYMRMVRPVPIVHNYKKRAFFFKELKTCSHVFLRNVAKKALEPPYSAPFKIENRISDAVYEIVVNGTARCVSTELLKPAFFLLEDAAESMLDKAGPSKDPSASADVPARSVLRGDAYLERSKQCASLGFFSRKTVTLLLITIHLLLRVHPKDSSVFFVLKNIKRFESYKR